MTTRRPLTKKEIRIIRLVCQGLTNAKIASILGVSEKTVKKHLEIIYKKLNIKSRYELLTDFRFKI